jgi:hypothetical protein
VRSSSALKDFFQHTWENWKIRPQAVLLVGDGTLDPRNYLGLSNFDFLPVKLVETVLLETASDEWLVDFDGDSVGEMAVGRLPARSKQEVERMVWKIQDYERTDSTASETLLITARNEGFDFDEGTGRLLDQIPHGRLVQEIDLNRLSDEQGREELLNSWQRAPSVATYLGHGSVEVWTGQGLMDREAVEQLTASPAPLTLALTCLNGFFHDVYTEESLAEALLRKCDGGATAVWASSGLSDARSQVPAGEVFLRWVFEGATLGEAAREAKLSTTSETIRQTWILFGDPLLRLRQR